MEKKGCKLKAWGLFIFTLLFYKLPVYASSGDPGDSAKRMFKMITVFALGAAAVIIIIILIVQLRKGSVQKMVDEDANRFSEKLERKREKKLQQFENQNLQSQNTQNPNLQNQANYSDSNAYVAPTPNQFQQTPPVPENHTILKPMPGNNGGGYNPQPAIPYEQPVSQADAPGVSIYSRAPRPKKVALADKGNGQKMEVAMADRITVGRNSNMSQLVIKGDKAVSGKHCIITYEMGQFYLEDLGSSNGTYVNKKKIKGKVAITNGDELVMGRRKYEIQFL